MNQKTTYEITITEKLEQLSAPHLREAIWNRISVELDMDMPENDNDPGSPNIPKKPGGISPVQKFLMLAVVAAIVTIFFFNKNQNKTSTHPGQSIPTTDQLTPVLIDTGPPPKNKTNTEIDIERIYPSPNNTPGFVGDSVMAMPSLNDPSTKDTSRLKTFSQSPVLSPLSPPVKKDSLPQKKPRGFKGITDDDYRINLKKDSVP